MALNYDFDVAMETDPARPGLRLPVARFRAADTVAALARADAIVQSAFARAGFRIEQSDAVSQAFTYRAAEHNARRLVVGKLESHLLSAAGDVARLDWGGFSIDAFFYDLIRARPVGPAREPRVASRVTTSRLDDMPLARLDAAEAAARRATPVSRIGLAAMVAVALVVVRMEAPFF